MPVVVRAVVSLRPGCKLYYDPPLRGDSFESDRFFDSHRGEYATFVEYSEDLVGVLDYRGRMPGRYINLEGLKVQFDGEKEVRSLNILHFVVVDAVHATVSYNAGDDQRLGDLPHPILFYPGDLVRFKPYKEGREDVPRLVRSLFIGKGIFAKDDMPRYEVMEVATETEERNRKFDEENAKRPKEKRLVKNILDGSHGWNTPGEELELVSRGNVWALYNDPSKLRFASDQEESNFWARDGISKVVASEPESSAQRAALIPVYAYELDAAYNLFAARVGDVLQSTRSKHLPAVAGEVAQYRVHILHECFAEHRERVRALTERLWQPQLQQSVA